MAAGDGQFAVDQGQRQRVVAGALDEVLDDRVAGELVRLLGEAEALDVRALLLRPRHVGREIGRRLVRDRATAALRKLEDLDVSHFLSPAPPKLAESM